MYGRPSAPRSASPQHRHQRRQPPLVLEVDSRKEADVFILLELLQRRFIDERRFTELSQGGRIRKGVGGRGTIVRGDRGGGEGVGRRGNGGNGGEGVVVGGGWQSRGRREGRRNGLAKREVVGSLGRRSRRSSASARKGGGGIFGCAGKSGRSTRGEEVVGRNWLNVSEDGEGGSRMFAA